MCGLDISNSVDSKFNFFPLNSNSVEPEESQFLLLTERSENRLILC